MPGSLNALQVLVIDCQASGATPAHGDLLEMGWAVADGSGTRLAPRAHWLRPGSDRPVSRAVKKLTGWDESCLESAIDADEAWARVRGESADARDARTGAIPTVIHFARFCHAKVTFREPRGACSRGRRLVLVEGQLVERHDLDEGEPLPDRSGSAPRPPSRAARLAAFDAARYDRLRVLATELRRIVDQGGDVTVHVGSRVLPSYRGDRRGQAIASDPD